MTVIQGVRRFKGLCLERCRWGQEGYSESNVMQLACSAMFANLIRIVLSSSDQSSYGRQQPLVILKSSGKELEATLKTEHTSQMLLQVKHVRFRMKDNYCTDEVYIYLKSPNKDT